MATTTMVAAGDDHRNLGWRKDTSTFGYKMMMKMGWAEGKGLGKNESGTAHNITIKRRPDQLGLGANQDEQGNSTLTKGFQDYGGILSALQAEFGSPTPSETKKKSKKSTKKAKKHRHNYHKVLRAKDVKSYSSKDLSAILGVRVDVDHSSMLVMSTPTSVAAAAAPTHDNSAESASVSSSDEDTGAVDTKAAKKAARKAEKAARKAAKKAAKWKAARKAAKLAAKQQNSATASSADGVGKKRKRVEETAEAKAARKAEKKAAKKAAKKARKATKQ